MPSTSSIAVQSRHLHDKMPMGHRLAYVCFDHRVISIFCESGGDTLFSFLASHMEARTRLSNELKSLAKSRAYGCYARPSKQNILLWNCQIYHNGYFFRFTLQFTASYPFFPPTVQFVHPVFHPNIYPDHKVCLNILGGKWCPSFTIKDILNGLKQLLDYPNPNSPANSTAAHLFRSSKGRYRAKVEENCKKYHGKYAFIKE